MVVVFDPFKRRYGLRCWCIEVLPFHNFCGKADITVGAVVAVASGEVKVGFSVR